MRARSSSLGRWTLFKGGTELRRRHSLVEGECDRKAYGASVKQPDTSNREELFYRDLIAPQFRCKVTGNPCGTDTWMNDHECQCSSCQDWLRTLSATKEGCMKGE